MRSGLWKPLGTTLAATGLMVLGLGTRPGLGDEPGGRLGRLFRLGSGNAAAKAAPSGRAPMPGNNRPAPPSDYGTPRSPAVFPAAATAPTFPTAATAPTLADAGSGANMTQRLRPQPRVSRAATEAEPILTRVSLGRGDDGKQFGMFLQVFADGTVIDSDGVHQAGADVMRSLTEALQASELGRLKGHCGGPSADFVEQHYVTVYERSLGRIRANTFSYSGNPQGCDAAVRHLNAAIDAVATKVSPNMPASAPATGPTAAAPASVEATPPPVAPRLEFSTNP